jgi:hypothetical protein
MNIIKETEKVSPFSKLLRHIKCFIIFFLFFFIILYSVGMYILNKGPYEFKRREIEIAAVLLKLEYLRELTECYVKLNNDVPSSTNSMDINEAYQVLSNNNNDYKKSFFDFLGRV